MLIALAGLIKYSITQIYFKVNNHSALANRYLKAMTYTIKPAVRGQEHETLQLIQEGTKSWAKGIYEAVRPWFDETYTLITIIEKINHSEIFVAVENQKIIGTITLTETNPEQGHLSSLSCKVKGKGIGSSLFSYTMEEARKRNYAHLTMAVYESNIPSISLIEKLGGTVADVEVYDNITYINYKVKL